MPDPRRNTKARKIRVQTTGGREDLNNLSETLAEFASDKGFDLRVFDSQPFGDHGPLWKDQFELTERH